PRAHTADGVLRSLFKKNCVSALASPPVIFQLDPPSVLSSNPSSVVIQPRFALSNVTDVSQPEYGVLTDSQVAPPSLVRSNCPAKPEMNPFCASVKWIELSDHIAAVVFTCFHILPPSAVCRMVPLHPTAQPFFASRKYNASSDCVTPLFCAAQVRP